MFNFSYCNLITFNSNIFIIGKRMNELKKYLIKF